MDLGRLKRETAVEHEYVESLIPLMSFPLEEHRYRVALVSLHGFIKGWEAWSVLNAPGDLHLMLSERRRGHFLEADLLHFGDYPSKSHYIPAGKSFTDKASFLGAMYVIEGSSLGGQYIARHVEKALNLVAGQGDAYFRGYGERTGSMWHEFQQVLAAVPDDEAETVIAAAKNTYEAFAKWLVAE